MFVNVGPLFLFTLILILLGFSQVPSIILSKPGNGLNVMVTSSKEAYILGELINLNLDIVNNSSSDIRLKGTDVNSGYLKIFIASSDQKFKGYSNSTWGLENNKEMVIKAGESIKSQVKILWNFSPVNRFSNLEGFEKSHIMTDYAFPKAGAYFIRATLFIPGEKTIKIESAPIQILVREPAGEDLVVWNKVKGNGDFAYFIQQDDIRIPFYKTDERAKFQADIEQILNDHPNSFYAVPLRQSLDKYHASEAKRQEFLQKMQKQKPQ